MKKIVIAFIAFLCLSSFSKAQTYSMDDLYLNGGIGVGYSYGLLDDFGGIPLIWVSGEKGVYKIDRIGTIAAGGIISLKHIGYDNSSDSWNDFNFGGRALFHFDELLQIDKCDFFAGITLGFRAYKDPGFDAGDLVFDPGFNAFLGEFVGVRYELTPNLLGYAEMGYDISYLKLGLSFKL